MAPRRDDLSSWLEGTPGAEPGSGRLGLPPSGRGSVARPGRRVLGVGVDWLASMAVSSVFFPLEDPVTGGMFAGAPFATLGVFFVSTTVLVGLLGTTIGHRLVGVRVVRLRDLRTGPDGAARIRPPGPVAGVVRTVLLCLVIPAVVWDADGRGLHDVAAGTVVIRG